MDADILCHNAIVTFVNVIVLSANAIVTFVNLIVPSVRA